MTEGAGTTEKGGGNDGGRGGGMTEGANAPKAVQNDGGGIGGAE